MANICLSLPAELSIQPQLNSNLIPPHARSQTTPASHGTDHTYIPHVFDLLFLSVCMDLKMHTSWSIWTVCFSAEGGSDGPAQSGPAPGPLSNNT